MPTAFNNYLACGKEAIYYGGDLYEALRPTERTYFQVALGAQVRKHAYVSELSVEHSWVLPSAKRARHPFRFQKRQGADIPPAGNAQNSIKRLTLCCQLQKHDPWKPYGTFDGCEPLFLQGNCRFSD